MATVSNAGGLSAMGNAQQGTRGMSSGDLTRLKRLKGSKPSLVTELVAPIPAGVINPSPTHTFVLACIDPRYAAALEEYLLQTLNGSTYDLFILAGAALGGNLTGHGAAGPPPTCSVVSTANNWQTALLDHIQVAITLHNVTKILIVDHLNCGAYGACGGTDDQGGHNSQFTTLSAVISGHTFVSGPTFQITGLYFDTPVGPSTALRDYSGALQTTEYFPPTTGAKVLVLGCIDPRYTALLSSFLVNYKDVQFLYDLFILAGASLGANQSYNTAAFPTVRGNNPNTTDYPLNLLANNGAGIGYLGITWGPTFFDHLQVAIALHSITEVWVFDHLDCGAYKAIKFGNLALPDMDIGQHIPELAKLQGYIATTNPSLFFKGFVMDTQGDITKVIDSGGVNMSIPKTLGAIMNKTVYSKSMLIPRTTGGSRIRKTGSQYTDYKALMSADYVISGKNASNSGVTPQQKWICSCSKPAINLLNKPGLCSSCVYTPK